MKARFFAMNVQLQSYERALFYYERALFCYERAMNTLFRYERAYERAFSLRTRLRTRAYSL
jgi:hypothetical protein